MENSSELDPESLRRLTLRVCGEQELKANPISCILRTLDLVDRITGTIAPIQGLGSEIPAKNLLISRLEQVAQARGLSHESLAEKLEVGLTTLQSWQRGVYTPSKSNCQRIERFLADSEFTLTGAARAEESAKPGEPFAQQQQPEPESASQG